MMIAEDNILPPVLAGDSNQQTGKGGYFQFYEDAYADDGGAGEVTILQQIHQQSSFVTFLFYVSLSSVSLSISLSATSNSMIFRQTISHLSVG